MASENRKQDEMLTHGSALLGGMPHIWQKPTYELQESNSSLAWHIPPKPNNTNGITQLKRHLLVHTNSLLYAAVRKSNSMMTWRTTGRNWGIVPAVEGPIDLMVDNQTAKWTKWGPQDMSRVILRAAKLCNPSREGVPRLWWWRYSQDWLL